MSYKARAALGRWRRLNSLRSRIHAHYRLIRIEVNGVQVPLEHGWAQFNGSTSELVVRGLTPAFSLTCPLTIKAD
jgi:hypothetical protein